MIGSTNPRTHRIQQIALLVVLALALVTLFLVLRQVRTTPEHPNITFKVDADGGFARISYSDLSLEMTDPETESTPWKFTGRYSSGDTIYLTATNPSQYGSIECSILIDGQVWKTDKAKYPTTQVACAGIIP